MKILLFDMDGVLLTPHGYHQALQDTVARMGHALGFSGAALTLGDIHALEACGITNEWESAAMMLAQLVQALRDHALEISPTPLLVSQPIPPHGIPPPDFPALIGQLSAPHLQILPPIPRAKTVLPAGVHAILDAAYSIGGLSHRTLQEHVLGSTEFARVYQLPPLLNLPSYLLAHDVSNFSPALQTRLCTWLALPGHYRAIFTNRPSAAPDGIFCTHEAEMGAMVIGLPDWPLAATGGIVWLAGQRGTPGGLFNKPHGVHALAALRVALGDPLKLALGRAAGLALDGVRDPAWLELDEAEVWIFEDAPTGLHSLAAAQKILAAHGVHILPHLVGVAQSQVKRASLAQAGAQVFGTLEAALSLISPPA